MTGKPATFKQSDARRMSPAKVRDYVAAVRNGGMEPVRVVVKPDGSMELFSAEPAGAPPSALDDWLARRAGG